MKNNFRQNVNATLELAASSPQTLDDQLTGDRSQYGYNDDSSPAPEQGTANSLTTASGLPISKIVQGTKLYQQIMAMSDKNLQYSIGGVKITDENRTAMQSELLARKLAPGMKLDTKALWNDVGSQLRATGAAALGTPLVDTSNVLRMSGDDSQDMEGDWDEGERMFSVDHDGGDTDDKESLTRAMAGKHGADVTFFNHDNKKMRYGAEPRDGESVDADAMHSDVCDAIDDYDDESDDDGSETE